MIVYKTFTGIEYESKLEYDKMMKILLNRPISDYDTYQMGIYFLEFFPAQDFFNKFVDIINNFSHRRFVINYDKSFLELEMETNDILKINYYMKLNHIMGNMDFPVDFNMVSLQKKCLFDDKKLLLKDFINECKNAINETIEYWKNNGLSELTNSININFKNIGGTKCKNK